MRLRDWLMTDEHRQQCASESRGYACCMNNLPRDLLDADVPSNMVIPGKMVPLVIDAYRRAPGIRPRALR